MNLSALKRIIIVPLALHKIKKRYPDANMDGYYVLFLLHQEKVRGMTLVEISGHLKRQYHTRSRGKIQEIIATFVSKEFIQPVDGTSPQRFSITIAGILYLKEFENLIRTTPLPKHPSKSNGDA